MEKGIQQLAEEGATQVFKPLTKNELVVGAVGVLQFDLVAFRLRDEYRAECIWENSSTYTARWVRCDDEKMLNDFRNKNQDNLAMDGGGYLTYLATSRVNLQVVEDRWPDITFSKTREHRYLFMPTTDELKQRLHATAQQEHGEFAMALLVSEVIDPQIEGEKLRQSFIDLLAPIDQQESVDLRQLLAFFRQSGFASRR